MGKLSGYVWHEVLAEEHLPTYIGVSRKCWYKLPFRVWEKLWAHFMYAFEDRMDEGYPIDDIIWYLENINHGYPFMLHILKEVKNSSFEWYTPSTVSRGMLIFLMGVDQRNINRKKEFLKRYYCKKFKKFIKSFEQAVEKDIKQFKGISI